MTTAITAPAPQADQIERVLITGDLASLSPEQRVTYYTRLCSSLGLNPLTKPFEYIVLSNKLTLYAKRDATDQLRKLHGISITLSDGVTINGVYVIKAHAQAPDGRVDESTGAVALGNLTGEALANALMKTETKAKRRATLSICGLGLLDETEVETVPGARPEAVVIQPPQRRSAPAPVETPRPPAPVALQPPQSAKETPPAPVAPPAPAPPEDLPLFTDAEEVPAEDPRPAGVSVERAKLIKTGQTTKSDGTTATWHLYGFKFSDGVEATCFDSTMFDLACDAGPAGRLVRYETAPGKKPGTLTLTSIELA